MKIVHALSQSPLLRRMTLPVLKAFGFDFSYRHPWVPGVRILLNSFKHKGYWFFGKGRERQSMELFRQLIPSGSRIVEVGGHIGFISAYFARLAGPNGHLTVFEPGSNNLPYLRRNLLGLERAAGNAPVRLIEKAVGASGGEIEFYEDSLTGQNNSAVQDFEGLHENAKSAFTEAAVQTRIVEIVALDDVFANERIDFVKIDVEGFEYSVLEGMNCIIHDFRPILMVEVQASESDISKMMNENDYVMFRENGEKIVGVDQMKDNVFCLHRSSHAELMKDVFGTIESSER